MPSFGSLCTNDAQKRDWEINGTEQISKIEVGIKLIWVIDFH
jgi:hypothetical protein